MQPATAQELQHIARHARMEHRPDGISYRCPRTGAELARTEYDRRRQPATLKHYRKVTA